MDSQQRREPDVLIVGGGPAGLSAAILLGMRGADVLLVERHPAASRLPRAHLLNQRTMEIFTEMGMADDVYALSPPEDRWHQVAWHTTLAGPAAPFGQRIGVLQRPKVSTTPRSDELALEARELTGGPLRGLGFSLARGELLGITGLAGSGSRRAAVRRDRRLAR